MELNFAQLKNIYSEKYYWRKKIKLPQKTHICFSWRHNCASRGSKSVPLMETKEHTFPFQEAQLCLSQKQIYTSTRGKSVPLVEAKKNIFCADF